MALRNRTCTSRRSNPRCTARCHDAVDLVSAQLSSIMLGHRRHGRLFRLLVELHLWYAPGVLDVQNSRVQPLVMHGSSVAVPALTPRPPAPLSTRNPEYP